MLKSLRKTGSALLSIVLSLSLVLTPVSGAFAQIDDTEAPVLIHRQIDSGVAGELQTFLARVSDDFGVSEVVLYYRQSDSGEFNQLNMRPLVDSIGEYMIAIETSQSAYSGLQYYIEAIDMSGNVTNRGFEYAPIVLPLTAPAVATNNDATPAPEIAESPEPGPAAQSEGFDVSPTTILLGLGALLALGALAAGGSSGEDPPTDPPGTTEPGTVTLTVISDLPSVE